MSWVLYHVISWRPAGLHHLRLHSRIALSKADTNNTKELGRIFRFGITREALPIQLSASQVEVSASVSRKDGREPLFPCADCDAPEAGGKAALTLLIPTEGDKEPSGPAWREPYPIEDGWHMKMQGKHRYRSRQQNTLQKLHILLSYKLFFLRLSATG